LKEYSLLNEIKAVAKFATAFFFLNKKIEIFLDELKVS